MKSRTWVGVIILTIFIKWASWYPGWVEVNYSRGAYPAIAKLQRILFGWIPFSIGDLFYAFVILIFIYKIGRFFGLLFKKKLTRHYFKTALLQSFFIALFMYVLFNLFWGLNYNRKGIADQLKLEVKKYEMADLDTLTTIIQQRVNYYATFVTVAQRDSFDTKKRLFTSAAAAYKEAARQYSFLSYTPRSIKPSIFSYLGNYLGFQGYYNPFSGEAQVNTTVPRFLEPFVTTHEIAHQLGYGRENEANFVGYLACKAYDNNAFRYSVYYDLYNYAVGEVFRRDTTKGKNFQQQLHPQVLKDQQEFRDFYKRYKNPIEPIIMWGYGEFLKANNQPAGKRSYNEVVAWLIAYYKKFGTAAL
jgi:hypothetical protein